MSAVCLPRRDRGIQARDQDRGVRQLVRGETEARHWGGPRGGLKTEATSLKGIVVKAYYIIQDK